MATIPSLKQYEQKLPTQIPLKAVQSFTISGGISLLAGSTVPIAAAVGLIGATAVVIEAFVRPIMEKIFPKNIVLRTVLLVITFQLSGINIANSVNKARLAYSKVIHIIRPALFGLLNQGVVNRNEAMTFVV